jgi:glycolate oxidase FAD binding subunit
MRCERAPAAADAIVGVSPRSIFEPRSQEECIEVFKEARTSRLALSVVGGATALGLGAPHARLDAVVSSRGLDRIVEYAPSDQVVIVEAGMTLAALQVALAKSGQRLACDPPLADRATIGGLLATNDFGPLRARFGSLRDLVIGVSIVRADGTVARGGGKVVKNVAGFDLPKLMVGALGTLGMIATATFRLHPLPQASTTMRVRRLAPRGLRALIVRMREEHVEAAAIVAQESGGSLDMLLRFEGFSAGVAEQKRRMSTLVAPLERSADELSPAEASQAWAEHAALRSRGNARVKLSARPNALEAVASEVVPRLTEVLSGSGVTFYPTIGLCFVTGDVESGAAFAAAIDRARASLGSGDGWLVVHDLPVSARAGVDVWGPPPASFPLMKRLKERFDPDSRLNPGRFIGGL